jgi:hypothetical protein
MHDWPHVFYNNTLTGNITADYEGFGFPLSKEGGNWDYATNHYPVGNMTPHPLGIPDLPCSESLYISTPAVIGPTVNFLEYLSAGLSDTGYIQKYQNALQLFPGSPVWIATIVNLTNPVNSLSFDAMFVSTNTESGGLLSVLWNTNTIGLVDESAVQMGLKHYLFKFPNASANSTHILGFRLDPFTNALSSVIVTNVTLGQVGVSQPFTLTMTTNMHSELRVLQLQGQSDFTYTVEASTNLVNWKNIAVLVNTNGTVPFVDLESTNNNQRFYRAVAP